MWNFGAEDLEEAVMEISYQRKKKTENNDEDETQEHLVESLRKLILGKFDYRKSEFYEWSQTILDEVGLAIGKFIFINYLNLLFIIKVMENIPMKVETKTLAFTDPTAVANDRISGETSIIAFRATSVKNGQGGTVSYDHTKPGM